MRLRLVQLPCAPAYGIYPTYQLAAAVQELVRRAFLRAKNADVSAPPPPQPTVIAFTPRPTFTLGRRQHPETLGAAALALLQAPLTVGPFTFPPAIVPSLRGGLTTYHGPGQVVLWPVFDLKAPQLAQAWTVRAYSRLLETTTAGVLGRRFGVAAHTTADPGLWVGGGDSGREERKISALGVHLRRNISALGVAVNLQMPVTRGGDGDGDANGNGKDDAPTNPWRRFVPCGLDGKGVTCVADEVSDASVVDLTPESFASEWAAAFAGQLGLGPEVDRADQATVQQLVEQGYHAMQVQPPTAEAAEGATKDDEQYVAWVAGAEML